MTSKILFTLLVVGITVLAAGESPVLRFAVVADIQYADKPPRGKRQYRDSKAKLASIVDQINQQNVDFIIQLGDLIDEGEDSLDAILPIFRSLRARQYHVVGNHDLSFDRSAVLERLAMKAPYYDFSLRGWRFVVLDGMDVSADGSWPSGSPNRIVGERMLAELKARSAPNAVAWNGGIGESQKRWLQETLEEAGRRNERVIVFCHFPVLAASSTPVHLLWNHEEVLKILAASPTVVAYMNGHDHQGGYAEERGIHFLTVSGVVESGEENAFATVEVFADRLEIRGSGTVPHRSLTIGAPDRR
jgi:3',5'-cyclic AMP phosphodiesterase CpdA